MNLDEVKKFVNRRITLDCNVFLVYLLDKYDPTSFAKFKRISVFNFKDYILLSKIIQDNDVFLSTNVLTEASNLLEGFKGLNYTGLQILEKCIIDIENIHRNPTDIIKNSSFLKFGLSDSSLETLSNEGIFIITVDFPLYAYLSNYNKPVINFHHVRQALGTAF